jgi:hypothetical protein
MSAEVEPIPHLWSFLFQTDLLAQALGMSGRDRVYPVRGALDPERRLELSACITVVVHLLHVGRVSLCSSLSFSLRSLLREKKGIYGENKGKIPYTRKRLFSGLPLDGRHLDQLYTTG